MKKKYVMAILTLVLCCTCALLVTGCEEYAKWRTLTITGEPSTCSVYPRDGEQTFQEWSNEVFKSVTLTYENTRDSSENFECKGLEEFRKKGGRLTFNPNSAGEHTAIFSYAGASVEIKITVTE